MSTMTKKTTILFPPNVYRQLERVAREQGVSVAQLVRQAAIQSYLLADQRTRREAVRAIAAMNLPVGSWREMEVETTRARLAQS